MGMVFVELVDRTADRGLAPEVEGAEAVRVVEDVRDLGLEAVELEQHVVTEGEQDVQVRHGGCQVLGQQRPRSSSPASW